MFDGLTSELHDMGGFLPVFIIILLVVVYKLAKADNNKKD
jgi:hypothetical protein